jgi:large subunit ribosomal protein L4
MPKAKVFDMSGTVIGEMDLPEDIFGIDPSEDSVHTVVKAHLAARRQGTQSTLTRAEVRGGGIKPWRQKGTGRARQGSTRSPQWTHGGVALGPKPRSYRFSVNRKIRRLALKSILSAKAAEGSVYVVDGLDLDAVKTKSMISFLKAAEITNALLVTNEVKQNVLLSSRNIPGVETTVFNLINVYDIIKHKAFVVDKQAVELIKEVYGREIRL